MRVRVHSIFIRILLNFLIHESHQLEEYARKLLYPNIRSWEMMNALTEKRMMVCKSLQCPPIQVDH